VVAIWTETILSIECIHIPQGDKIRKMLDNAAHSSSSSISLGEKVEGMKYLTAVSSSQ